MSMQRGTSFAAQARLGVGVLFVLGVLFAFFEPHWNSAWMSGNRREAFEQHELGTNGSLERNTVPSRAAAAVTRHPGKGRHPAAPTALATEEITTTTEAATTTPAGNADAAAPAPTTLASTGADHQPILPRWKKLDERKPCNAPNHTMPWKAQCPAPYCRTAPSPTNASVLGCYADPFVFDYKYGRNLSATFDDDSRLGANGYSLGIDPAIPPPSDAKSMAFPPHSAAVWRTWCGRSGECKRYGEGAIGRAPTAPLCPAGATTTPSPVVATPIGDGVVSENNNNNNHDDSNPPPSPQRRRRRGSGMSAEAPPPPADGAGATPIRISGGPMDIIQISGPVCYPASGGWPFAVHGDTGSVDRGALSGCLEVGCQHFGDALGEMWDYFRRLRDPRNPSDDVPCANLSTLPALFFPIAVKADNHAHILTRALGAMKVLKHMFGDDFRSKVVIVYLMLGKGREDSQIINALMPFAPMLSERWEAIDLTIPRDVDGSAYFKHSLCFTETYILRQMHYGPPRQPGAWGQPIKGSWILFGPRRAEDSVEPQQFRQLMWERFVSKSQAPLVNRQHPKVVLLWRSKRRREYGWADIVQPFTEWLWSKGCRDFYIFEHVQATSDELVRAMADADIMIGIFGAGYTWMSLMPKGGVVVEMSAPWACSNGFDKQGWNRHPSCDFGGLAMTCGLEHLTMNLGDNVWTRETISLDPPPGWRPPLVAATEDPSSAADEGGANETEAAVADGRRRPLQVDPEAKDGAVTKRPIRVRPPRRPRPPPPGPPPPPAGTRRTLFDQGNYVSLKTWKIAVETALCKLRNPSTPCPLPEDTGVRDSWDRDYYEET